ncbi:MAG: hypothetical protein Q8Q31_05180 [Nanoarchaeota archaeon]|nr:hypothetical protein [Nanoarchaeota archaeon]
MARKYQGKPTFSEMMADLKRQKEETLKEESDPNLHYMHLIVSHEVGQERHVDRLFQNLSPFKKRAGTGSVVQDPNYRHTGVGYSSAFILRTTDLTVLESTVQQASAGLPVRCELREY